MLKFNRSIEDLWRIREDADPKNFLPIPAPDMRDRGDLFSILHDENFKKLLRQYGSAAEHSAVEPWVCTFKSSAGGPVYSPHVVEQNKNPHFLLFLDEIRRHCVIEFEKQLKAACVRQEIPREGVCLVFPDNISVCYFLEYAMSADQVQVKFSDHLGSPRALLGLDEAAALPKARSKNLAKSFIQSGHKTIIHGGILTHVDRRLFPKVFGPTIDTLLIASILSDCVRKEKPHSVLEVGIGSGHIITTAAVYSSESTSVCGIDIEPNAVMCSDANLRRDREVFGLSNVKSKLVIGEFDAEFFAGKFDILVSNPPYIWDRGGTAVEGRKLHQTATSGTGLIQTILTSLPALLEERGKALLMLSSATMDVARLLPSGFDFSPCLPEGSVTVPFDVEAVLDDENWLDELVKEGALNKVAEGYTHELRPVWVRRKGC